ncbi:MAG: hypothetical protein WBM83_12615 [Flavobacteriaceae bacterium]
MKHTRCNLLIVLLVGISSCKEQRTTPVPTAVSPVHEMPSPAKNNSAMPFLFSNDHKTLLSWVETVGDSLAILNYAELIDGAWQEPSMIAQGTDWFVNWADFPAITEHNGTLLTHMLKKSSVGTYSYDIKLNLLTKGEKEWKNNLPLHDDQTPTEHGFVTTLPYGSDSFFMTWLDGRNTEEKEGEERGAMTLRTAEVNSLGALQNEALLDPRTCDCCQTTAAITSNGPVVLYRDRTENEVRDISIVRKIAGEWSAPKTIHADNWLIKGCPVNGPKAAALENTLAVAWFTAADNSPQVKLVFSADGGENFDAPIVVSPVKTIGRVDVVLLDMNTAIVSYMEMIDKQAQLKAVKVKRSGEIAKPVVISELDASRKTGFPQMELVQDKVYFAWTDVDQKNSAIKTAFVALEAF